MKRVWVSIVIIALAMVPSAGLCSCTTSPWTLISPPDVDIVDMQAYQASDFPSYVLVLARTSDGRILSTGIVGPDEGYEWTDISGGHAWSDFPEVASAEQQLFIRYEGSLYWPDASGQWQRVEEPDSLFTCQIANAESLSADTGLAPPAGEVVKAQYQRTGVEAPVLHYALVKGRGVFFYRTGRGAGGFGSCSTALLVLCAVCLLALLLRRKS